MRSRPTLTFRSLIAPAALLACAGWIATPRALSAAEDEPGPTLGSIERLDPALDEIIAPDARMERIAEGFTWVEGPVWDAAGERLLFSDTMHNVVHQWKKGQGVGVFLRPSGYTGETPRGGEPGSNGLTFDHEGRLVLCQHGDRRIARARLDGDCSFTTLVNNYEGKRLNSPNDGVFKSNGDYYFTDPFYGLLGENHDEGKELDFSGVYRLSKDGTLTLLTKELKNPNGLAFSPDEKTLYVGNSDPQKAIWMAYPVKDDGTIGPGRLFGDVTERVGKVPGLPDGLKVDEKGNIFATGPGGVLIFNSEGKHLGTLATGEPTGNCAFGEDGSVLYITANKYLARIPLKTKGPIPGARRP